MRELRILITQKINLKSKIEKAIKVFLILISSCKEKNESLKSTEEVFFYKISYTDLNRVDYSFRKYQFYGDTIKLNVKYFDKLGQVVTNNGEGGLYIINDK
jgi:hypothetical protein